MENYRLEEVTTPVQAAQFITVNVEVNKGNPAYVRPLDKDVAEVFDEKKNKTFRFGKAVRWILMADGKPVGRIAAFTNKKYRNKGDDVPVGGIGFLIVSITSRRLTNCSIPRRNGWYSKAWKPWTAPSTLANVTAGGAW